MRGDRRAPARRSRPRLKIPYIFKASYDKANRSSRASFRGPGIDAGLKTLAEVRRAIGVPVLTDVHEDSPLAEVAAVVDVLQTPAFLCRQTNFILNTAAQGKPVNIKKGQFLSPWEMQNVVDKARSTGNAHIMVCERGFSFGYNNLVSDMRSLAIMRATGCPVVFDATHSVQLPGGQGSASGGQREFIPVLARAAVATGIAGLFMETHPRPEQALSDGPNAWPLQRMDALLSTLVRAGPHGQARPLRRIPAAEDLSTSMSKITDIRGREIIDSRGNPTVEADVVLDSGIARTRRGALGRLHRHPRGGRAARQRSEALRRQGRAAGGGAHQYGAAPGAARCRPARSGRGIDARMIELDGTENKARLGANALLGVSLATAHAAAADAREPLYRYLARLSGEQREPVMPVPMMNIINGGAHANNSLDVQEFMILPVGAPSFREAVRYGAEVFHALKKLLAARGLSTAVGDEGGFAPDLDSNEAALGIILEAIEKAGYRPGRDIYLGLDVASSEFFKDGRYELESEKRRFSAAEFTAYLGDLAARYPIITIEDGMSEADWDGWTTLTRALGGRLQLVGDDVFVTNTRIFREAIERHIANAILIKPNQIGTLTETLAAIDMADKAHYGAVVSHRSGETEDSTIADIAVASAATQIKTGSMSRSDRVAKYNQLLRIEAELGSVRYAGREAFPVRL